MSTKDEYKRKLNNHCGIAGLHCECCNDHHGKHKKKLNRMARASLKAQDMKRNKENE